MTDALHGLVVVVININAALQSYNLGLPVSVDSLLRCGRVADVTRCPGAVTAAAGAVFRLL